MNISYRYKKRIGISLVEILCAMVILSLITLAAVYLLDMGAKSNAAAVKEFDLQSSARTAMETVTNKIRYSTAVFIIPESGFKEDNLENGWDYVGVLKTDEGLNEIVMFQYVQDSVTGSWYHKKTVLLRGQENFVFDLEFTKQDEDYKSRLIEYIFSIYQNGEECWILGSEAEAMNSLQVVNWGTAANKGRAIAYQSMERETQKTIGRVALVLDVSGSMTQSFVGNTTPVNERHKAMVQSALELLDTFKEYDNIEVAIIPYSTSADFSALLADKYGTSNYAFLNAQSDYTKLCNIVNSLKPEGGTNTGDGLRRAYYAFLDDDSVGMERTSDYIVLLSDGDMTLATMKALPVYSAGAKLTTGDIVDRNFHIDPGNAPNTNYGLLLGTTGSSYFNTTTGEIKRSTVDSKIKGYGSYFSSTVYNQLAGCIYGIGNPSIGAIDVYSKGYVDSMGSLLRTYGVTPYFVAVSSSVSTKGKEIVKKAFGINDSSVYHPLSQAELLNAFKSIGDDIVNNLWFINGPLW